MFRDCESLIEGPELPATELAESCYWGMFTNCTSLTKAPILPAKTLSKGCYEGMFWECNNLSYVKALFVNVPPKTLYSNWLVHVASTGTFVKSKDATWNVKDCGIPEGWTVVTE